MDDLLNINVDYKYINDTENTVAFKTFRNSISSENEYTDPSDSSQKEGNFKQTETALNKTNTNFINIQQAINTLEDNYTSLSDDVDTYLGQTQIFNIYADLQSVEQFPTENAYIMQYPTNLTQQPQEGCLLLMQVGQSNSRGTDTTSSCSITLTFPSSATSRGYTTQKYRLLCRNTLVPRYGLKTGNIYAFVLDSSGQFMNVESKITRREAGTFNLSSSFSSTPVYGNSWTTDGSNLYINLVLGGNMGKVNSNTPTVIANLSNNTYFGTLETDWFPAMVRSTARTSNNVPILYVRCQIKNNQLIAIAPGTASNPTTFMS